MAAAMFAVPLTAAYAFNAQRGNNIVVEEGETFGGNFYAAGSQIIIDGTVTGDLFCAGATVTINGTVGGDVICAASSIAINGEVGGDVRAATSNLAIDGRVNSGLTAFSSAISINDGGSVGGNTLAFGATLRADGPLNGDVQFFGASLAINSRIGGDVYFYGRPQHVNGAEPAVTLRPNADIIGGLAYYEGVDTAIADAATVAGNTTVMALPKTPNAPDVKNAFAQLSLWWTVWNILAAIVIGLILIALFPRQTAATTNNMLREADVQLAWGLLAVILTPLVIVLLIITVIGLPLALLLLLLFTAAWMIAKVLAAITVGAWIARTFKWNIALYWQMIIGVIVAYLIFMVPIIGWIAWLLAIIWGFGGLIKHCWNERNRWETPIQKQAPLNK